MSVTVNADAIYTKGQNSVNVTKGSWSASGGISFTPSAGSGTGAAVALSQSQSWGSGDTGDKCTVTITDNAGGGGQALKFEVDAGTRYSTGRTFGQNEVNINKGGWSGGNISFTKSVGTASTKTVSLTASKTTSSGVTTVDIYDDGSRFTGCSTTVSYADAYAAGWAAAKAKISLSDNKIVGPPDTVDGAAITLYTVTAGVDSGQIYHSYGSTLYKCDIVGYAYINGDAVRSKSKQVQTTISS